jgi:hypothetical protein
MTGGFMSIGPGGPGVIKMPERAPNLHDSSTKDHNGGVVDLFGKAAYGLERLASKVCCDDVESDDFRHVYRMLVTLPLATSEFALSVRRLNNAWQYSQQNERGAAVYELQLLRSCLRQRVTPPKL